MTHLPELENLIEKRFHYLFSEKENVQASEGAELLRASELKLRSTSSKEKKIHDEITRITWKTKLNFEIRTTLKIC